MSSCNSIPVAKPWLGEEEAAAARRAILSGWVTQGPEVAAFEKEFAAYVGAPHACAVANCTTALHLALRAAGAGPGDEVITVSCSFIATANAVVHAGAVPVFVDVDRDYQNIDPDKVEHAITPRTRAILCVHQIGMPCDLPRLAQIARRHGLPLVEDAACAIGSEILWNDGQWRVANGQSPTADSQSPIANDRGWEKIGKPHGDVACFSFHPRKLVTTGDGGMITTARADWDGKFRLWRQHSMTVPDTARHQARQVIFEQYSELGYNYRMTDIQAAVGREQLRRLPAMLERRRAQAQRYRSLLAAIPGLGVPCEPAWARTNWQSYSIRLPDYCNQRAVMQTLLDAGISARRGVMCAHREPAYAGRSQSVRSPLPESEFVQDRTIILPLFHEMTEADQDRVVKALAEACEILRSR
jgi:dTDP-4-amino-4,6-dideoxygalactose transaminase